MDEAELRRQERALMRGIGICLLAFAAGTGLWLYNQHTGKIIRPAAVPPQVQAQAEPPKLAAPMVTPPTIPPIQALVRRATGPGPVYVHRAGSVLRDTPKPSGKSLKKESKGAKLILVGLQQGGWAKVSDGDLTGYMRASVLGADPPT